LTAQVTARGAARRAFLSRDLDARAGRPRPADADVVIDYVSMPSSALRYLRSGVHAKIEAKILVKDHEAFFSAQPTFAALRV